jgi:DnaJ-like protein
MSTNKPKRQDWDSYAEEQIRAAQEEGLFDNLPGFGQPISGIDEPYDENWWVRQKLKRERLSALPPALAIKLDVERTLAAAHRLTSECEVRREMNALNERTRHLYYAAAWGPSCELLVVDVAAEVAKWRAEKAAASDNRSRLM